MEGTIPEVRVEDALKGISFRRLGMLGRLEVADGLPGVGLGQVAADAVLGADIDGSGGADLDCLNLAGR